MALSFALVMEPAASDAQRPTFADTFSILDPSAPVLRLGELSAQRGDGVFESIGVVDRHPQNVDAHLERFARSADACELRAPNRAQWREAIAVAAEACGQGEGVVKAILSRGVEQGPAPTAWVTAGPAPDFRTARERGIRVVTLDRGYDSAAAARAPWLLLGAKTLSYAVNMAAIREARRRGADDAIFVSSDGLVLEAPTANVVLRLSDRFVTPDPGSAILHGTTQQRVFDYLDGRGFETAYESVPASALPGADAAWLVSSLRLAAPVVEVDGAAIPHDAGLTAQMNGHLLSRLAGGSTVTRSRDEGTSASAGLTRYPNRPET